MKTFNITIPNRNFWSQNQRGLLIYNESLKMSAMWPVVFLLKIHSHMENVCPILFDRNMTETTKILFCGHTTHTYFPIFVLSNSVKQKYGKHVCYMVTFEKYLI